MIRGRKPVVVVALIVLLSVSGAAQSDLVLSGDEISIQASAETVEVPFTLGNTGDQPVTGPSIGITDLPPGWSIDHVEADGGTVGPDDRQVLYLQLDDGDSVTPTWTLKLPEDPAACTYTVTGNLIQDGSTVQTVETTITVEGDTTSSGTVHRDDVLRSGQTFWWGQGLFFDGSTIVETGENASRSDRAFQIRRLSNGNTIGKLIKEFTVGSNGETVLSTDCLDGNYVITRNGNPVEIDANGNGSVIDNHSEQTVRTAAWEVNTHSLSATLDEDDTPVRPGQTASIEIDSNRANYVVNVSASDLDSDDLMEIFGQPDDGNDVQYVDAGADVVGITAEGDDAITANFSTFTQTGRYDFEFKATDTPATATVPVELNRTDEELAFANPNVFTDQEGDRVNVTVEMTDGSRAWVFIGSEEVNFLERVEIEDENEDGTVRLTVNTFSVHNQSNGAYDVSDGDDLIDVTQFAGHKAPNHQRLANLSIEPQTRIHDSIEASQYDLRVAALDRVEGVDGAVEIALQEDQGVIDLKKRSTDSIQTFIAPTGRASVELDDVLTNATRRNTVTLTDRLIVRVVASGLYGYLDDEEVQTLTENGLELRIEQTNTPPNTDAAGIDPTGDGVALYTKPGNDRFYVVLDLRNVDPINQRELQDGQIHDVTFSIYGGGDATPSFPSDRSDANPYVKEDHRERVSTTVTFRTPAAEFDGVRDDKLLITQSQEVRISGTSNAPPHTKLTIQLHGTESYPLSVTQTAIVTEQGTFSTTIDTASVPVGTNFTATIKRNGNELTRINGRVVDRIETPTPKPTPTIRSPTPQIETETIVKTKSPAPSPSPRTRTVVRTKAVTRTIVRTPTETPGQPGFGLIPGTIVIVLAILWRLLRRSSPDE